MKYAKNSMSIEKAKTFIGKLCGSTIFGKQIYQECVGRLHEVGYPVWEGKFGGRSGYFVSDFNVKSLTNHYNKVLNSYE